MHLIFGGQRSQKWAHEISEKYEQEKGARTPQTPRQMIQHPPASPSQPLFDGGIQAQAFGGATQHLMYPPMSAQSSAMEAQHSATRAQVSATIAQTIGNYVPPSPAPPSQPLFDGGSQAQVFGGTVQHPMYPPMSAQSAQEKRSLAQ